MLSPCTKQPRVSSSKPTRVTTETTPLELNDESNASLGGGDVSSNLEKLSIYSYG